MCKATCRGRYYDTTKTCAHGCGSYSYITTTRPNTTSSMQTLAMEERSYFFLPKSGGKNGHRLSSSRRTSSSATARKNAEKKKPGAQTWAGQFMCLSDRISDEILNPTQKQIAKFAKGRTWTEANYI